MVVIHDFPGGGLGKHVDYSAVSRHLDLAAYNNYPVWGGQREPLAPHEIAFGLDYIRGLKQQNFWITEAIMGAQGHDVTGFSPRPDQAKMWAYQSMARGCEALFFFRYRGATKGAEQFCYGVLDADNVKRRKFYEVQSFFRDIKSYASQLETPIRSEVAIVYDYDSLAAFRIQRQSVLLNCEAEMKKYHKFFYDRNVPVDVIPADSDLTGYKVLILPQMIVAKPDFQQKLKAFVESGGTVVLTYRDFVKDINNNLVLGKRLPIDFDAFAGICVAETESLQEGQEFPLVGEGGFAGAPQPASSSAALNAASAAPCQRFIIVFLPSCRACAALFCSFTFLDEENAKKFHASAFQKNFSAFPLLLFPLPRHTMRTTFTREGLL